MTRLQQFPVTFNSLNSPGRNARPFGIWSLPASDCKLTSLYLPPSKLTTDSNMGPLCGYTQGKHIMVVLAAVPLIRCSCARNAHFRQIDNWTGQKVWIFHKILEKPKQTLANPNNSYYLFSFIPLSFQPHVNKETKTRWREGEANEEDGNRQLHSTRRQFLGQR